MEQIYAMPSDVTSFKESAMNNSSEEKESSDSLEKQQHDLLVDQLLKKYFDPESERYVFRTYPCE